MEKERALLEAKIQDKIEHTLKRGTKNFIDFLDPAQQEMARRLMKKIVGIQYVFFGGHVYCERKNVCIYPKNEELEICEWPIGPLHIKPKTNKKKIRHPEILGSVLNLGLKRDKIGDINIFQDYIQIFISKELVDFVLYNLNSISNIPVLVEKISWDHVIPFKEDFKEQIITVASLRLDGVVSGIYNISRKEASYLIKSGKVKVNWEFVDKGSILLNEKDIVSVRRKGRALIYEELGTTKKGNKKLLIHKFN